MTSTTTTTKLSELLTRPIIEWAEELWRAGETGTHITNPFVLLGVWEDELDPELADALADVEVVCHLDEVEVAASTWDCPAEVVVHGDVQVLVGDKVVADGVIHPEDGLFDGLAW